MTTHDEVLTVDTINDRLRELEAQQAASEPVAWALRDASVITAVAEFLFYHFEFDPQKHDPRKYEVSDDRRTYYMNTAQYTLRAVERAMKALHHPSAAAVRVTDAMVEAARKWRSAFLFERMEDTKAARRSKEDAEDELVEAVRALDAAEGRDA